MTGGAGGRSRSPRLRRALGIVQVGLVANAALVVVKVLAGLIGHSYALVADGIESSLDVFSSLVVWRGLQVSERDPDGEFHFGYGKAESVSAAAVGLMLVAASVIIVVEAVRNILTPHEPPAPFTLAVLVAVIAVKEVLFRRVFRAGSEAHSPAVVADAWHHRSDAITSTAALIGITIALVGGPGWAVADEWAAIVAAGVIAYNGRRLIRPAVLDLMDRAPDADVLGHVRSAAEGVPGVLATEKLRARKVGMGYYVDLHVQADPAMTLEDAHELGHDVKRAILAGVPIVIDALIHMEPYPRP